MSEELVRCDGSDHFHIRWMGQFSIHQKLLEEFLDEKEPWLLLVIPSRDPSTVTQYLERHSVSYPLIVIGYTNIQEDVHRGENYEEIHKTINH